jgi:hypothetical protein
MPDARFAKIDADGRAIVEFEKLRLELAWRHFEFHARQRTTMFHFYILLLPFLIGGFFYILKQASVPSANVTAAATLVAFIGAVLSLVFWAFDVRNRQLYRVSQENIKLLESNFLYTRDYVPLTYQTSLGDQLIFHGIINEEESRYRDGFWDAVIKHKLLMPALYILTFIIFIFLALCLHVKWL